MLVTLCRAPPYSISRQGRQRTVDAVSIIAVIPARFGSSRLPGKALAEINGVPMVVRVWRQASKARSLARVVVATDDERIAAPVREAGAEAIMTSPAHVSGTDRIAEVARL